MTMSEENVVSTSNMILFSSCSWFGHSGFPFCRYSLWSEERLADRHAENPTQKDDYRAPEADQQLPSLLGGWRSMPFILLNELAERLASVGLALNLITYLMGEYNLTQVAAASLLNIVSGTASLTPLLGAFLADAYLGRFWTIILASFSNLIQSGLLISTATFRSLRPADNQQASHGQVAFLIIALTFGIMAAGGLRPCTYAFGADQFQAGSLEDKKHTQSFFNWYFFLLYAASLSGATFLVYLQDNAGWVWGFGVPGAFIVIAITLLFLGSSRFRFVRPTGSPFTDFVQVVVAAFWKRNNLLPLDPSKLHQGGGKEAYRNDLLPHTDRLKWLDHAGIETEADFNEEDGSVRNRFRLCTVHQIEQLKAIVGLAPIWTINLLSTTVLSQHSSFNIPQARTMDRHIGPSFQISPASLSVFASITLMIWMPLYDKVVVPKLRKITGHPGGIKVLQRIGIGFFISVLALLISGLVESRRRLFAREHGFTNKFHKPIPLSVFWLVPQHCLYGLSESFHAVGQLEFLYDQLPNSMRSMAGAVFWCSSGFGHYGGTIILQLVHKFTRTPDHEDWLTDNLNRGHLDYFFYLLAVLQLGNFLAFLGVARRYTYKGCDRDDHKQQQQHLVGGGALKLQLVKETSL